jgi:hypothetical protein
LYFYNGLIDCETYYIESGSLTTAGVTYAQNKFPYFDNYNVVSGSFPTVDSDSLLFNNELASYGQIPTENLYTQYWETYVSLLYNPKTRLLTAEAIIPLADYFKMELNDVVNFRGNYYHLRAINDYSLKTGECTLQLLGPIISDTLSDLQPEPTPPAPPATGSASSSVSWSFTETRQTGTFTVFDNAVTLATLTANGTGNAQVSQSHYVTASLVPVGFPASGSVTMSLFVNGGTTLSQTVYTNTTISASFLVASGSAYGITGSIEFNDSGSAPATGSTLAWSFSETGGAVGTMDLYVNGSIVETRTNTSNGTYAVNVGDTINVELNQNQCSGGSTYANVSTTGIIVDANCVNNGTVSLVTSAYTVLIGDVGNTLSLDTFSSCDGGCL